MEQRIFDILIIILFTLFVINVFLRPGIIAWGDGSYWFRNKMVEYFSLPYLDEYPFLNGGAVGLHRFPYLFFQSVIMLLFNVNFAITQRLFFYVIPPLICTVSSYFLVSLFLKKRYSKIISAIISFINPFSLGSLIGGQVSIFGAYSFIPLALYFYFKSIKKLNLLNILLTGFFIAIVGFYDIRILFVFYLCLSFLFIFNLFIKKNKSVIIKSTIYSVIISLLFNSYWILPSMFFKNELPIGYTNPGWLNVLSHDMIDFFFLASTSLTSNESFFYYLFIIMIPVAILSLLLRNKQALSFSLIFSVFLFLSKGHKLPFGEIYLFLFEHFPFFGAFRDASKFFLISNLFFAYLCGFGIDYLLIKKKKYEKIIISMFFILMILYTVPYWMGTAGKSLNLHYSVPETQVLFNDFLINESEGKYFSIPSRLTYWFSTQKNPSAEFDCYSILYFCDNILSYTRNGPFFRNETRDFNKFLNLLHIKYILLHPEDYVYSRGPLNSKDKLFDLLSSQNSLSFVNVSGGVFVNNDLSPLFYATDKATILVGNRNGLFKLTEKINFTDRIIYFSHDVGNNLYDIMPFVDSVIFSNSTFNDLLLDSLDSYHIDLSKNKGSFTNIYSDPLINYYGVISNNILYGDRTLRLVFDFNSNEDEIYEVWLRGSDNVLDYSGFLSINNNDLPFDFPSNNSLNWIKIGQIDLSKGNHEIRITALNKVYFDDLVIMKKDLIENQRHNLNTLISNKTSFNSVSDFNLTGSYLNVSYNKINPSYYELNISNSNSILVFSDNHDLRWIIDNSKNLKAFNSINSFIINQTNVILYDKTQVYTNIGLIISVTTFIILLIIILNFFLFRKK